MHVKLKRGALTLWELLNRYERLSSKNEGEALRMLGVVD